MKVKAAVAYEEQRQLAIEDLELSGPGPDDILVRMVGCGLCHTDVKARDGQLPVPKPVVLGHEGAGVVERVGARVTKVKPGNHVVLSYDSCGVCQPCQRGDLPYCDKSAPLNFLDARAGETGSFSRIAPIDKPSATGEPQSRAQDRSIEQGQNSIHGHFFGQSSFATFAISRSSNTVPVPQNAPLEILGVLGCGVQTGAGAIMNALRPNAGSSIAIFGAGPVGLSAVLAAVLCGCTQIIAVDVVPARLEMAKQLGATHAVLAEPNTKVSDEIHKTVPDGVDFAFDTTARADSYLQAIASLARKGHFGFVAAPVGNPELNIDMSLVMNRGLTIRGIVQGDSTPEIFIPQLIDLYIAGRFPFDKFLTKYPFAQINQAIDDQSTGKVIKPVFVFPV
jgi:aryl-alcohol dehydrogenase